MASPTSQDSPVVFPPNAFNWPATIFFVIGIGLVLFAVMLATGIAWALAGGLDLGTLARIGMPAVVMQGVGEIGAVIFVLVLLPVVARTPLRSLGFRGLSASQAGTIALGTVLMWALVTPVASALQNALHFKTPEAAVAVFVHASGFQRALFAFFGVVIAPLFEEALFRWTIFNAMRKWWGFWPGAIVSSALFGLAHVQPPWTWAMAACLCLPLALGGMVLCWVYARTNNAWASFATHGAFNAVTFVLLLLFPQLAK